MKNIFYVYQYSVKATGDIIYIGKGKDGRMNTHLSNARKGDSGRFYDTIRAHAYEEGLIIEKIKEDLEEYDALKLEVQLIQEIGRVDFGTGTLLNMTDGGEGISGGIDQYGYKRLGIARWITDIVHEGVLIEEFPQKLEQKIIESGKKFKSTTDRIVSHLCEMGNVGYHYKGPVKQLMGWQFSLDGKMIDINTISLSTKGFLKVHGDLPWNKGFVGKPQANLSDNNNDIQHIKQSGLNKKSHTMENFESKTTNELFWEKFFVAQNAASISLFKDKSHNAYAYIKKGLSKGIRIVCAVNARADKMPWVEIEINNTSKEFNLAAFNYLESKKESLQNAIGGNLEFCLMEGKKAKRIKLFRNDLPFNDESNWDETIAFFLEYAPKVYKAFKDPVNEAVERY